MDPHELRCHELIPRPYEAVRAALLADARGLFTRATGELAPALRLALGGVSVGAEIDLTVGAPAPLSSPWHPDATGFEVGWRARRHAALFPVMHGQLIVGPLSPRATRLGFAGTYVPPFGPLGEIVDAVVGGRVAEACVRRFVAGLVAELDRDPVVARSMLPVHP